MGLVDFAYIMIISNYGWGEAYLRHSQYIDDLIVLGHAKLRYI